MIDWNPYLEALCNQYAQWWKVYTLTDVVGRQRVEEKSPPLLDFMVETVQPAKEQPGEAQQKTERLGVLEGLRKYAADHVLLVGRPGSGKSTALARLLLEEAQASREFKFPADSESPLKTTQSAAISPFQRTSAMSQGIDSLADSRIPVLVELRYYQTSVLDLIRDFLKQHGLFLNTSEIERLLFEKRFLLLVDGINELPSEAARRDLKAFCQTNAATPMIFTTRDLGVGGDLDIAKKLEMQPLSEVQMQQFVCAYLPQQGEQMLRQLGNRLRELGETPLLLWMLCSLFKARGKVPPNLALVFRQFAQSYYDKLKQDVPISDESRRWCQLILQHLAWRMTQGREATELQVAISQQEAEEILTVYLRNEGFAQPRDRAIEWLADLLKYHLLQLGANNQIEFRHQLIQEHCTAESLLKLLPRLSDDELKREYLNYLKWTESLALMLELVEDEAQAVRVVKLALEVDLRLGARLAGQVKLERQAQTVGLVAGLEVPQLLQIQLLNLTKSEKAIPRLIKALEEENSNVRSSAASALGKIGSEAAIPGLVQAIEDADSAVCLSAASALGKIGSEAAIPGLIKALKHADSAVRWRAAETLGKIGSEAAIPGLIKALKHAYFDVRWRAAEALGKIGSEAAISGLLQALEDENSAVRLRTVSALGKIGSEAAIPGLVKALEDEDSAVRLRAEEALGKIGSEASVSGLVKALEDKDSAVRLRAAEALGKIRSEAAVSGLVKVLEDGNSNVRLRAAEALGKIRSEAAVSGLVKVLEDKDSAVRLRAAESLAKIGSQAAISELVKALENEDSAVRLRTASALGKAGSEAAISRLVKALEDEDSAVHLRMASALGKAGSEAAISRLVKALEDEDSAVRLSAVSNLGEIGSEAAVSGLVKALEDDNFTVHLSAASALSEIASQAAISESFKALEDDNFTVRSSTASALGKAGSEAAVPGLVKALEDENFGVRLSAVFTLGEIGSEAAISGLVKALEDEEFIVRSSAVSTLGKIGSETAISSLIKALQHEKFAVRLSAASALGKIGSQAAIPGLIKALEDENFSVRWSAASALGKIGSEAAIPGLIKALQHEKFAVRWSAAEALGESRCKAALIPLIRALKYRGSEMRSIAAQSLGKIGSEAILAPLDRALIVMNLIEAVNDKYLDVRRSAAEALGKVGCPKSLATLWKEQLQAKNTELSLAISAIQERYKFYNYTLTQPILTSEPAPNIPPIQPISTSLMHILHLSDLHFGTLDQANLWSNQLAADLYNDINISHLDALILSGDIANYSTEEEYQAAAQFLDNLRQDFPLNPEQIILVPGNHDLNWKQAKKAYKLTDRDDYGGELKDGHYIEESASVIRVRDETEYKQRFAHFSSFYETIKQKPYPLDYDQQYTLDHLKEQNLLILGLNSAWQLDHHYKTRASINTNALSNALTQIRRNPDYRNCLKIAVWHHPLDSAYSDRITDQGFLEQLAVDGFRFFLHGHIHKAETSLFRYEMSTNGRKLDRICAGTFGAPVREWVPGYPLQYNLLKFEDNQLTVYTRRREELNGAWKPDARWLQGKGKTPLDYYAIAL